MPAPAEGLTVAAAQALGDVLPVPPALAGLLPAGIPRGSIVQISGSTSLLLAMAGAACTSGAWCAMAAVPDIGWQAAQRAGLELDRVVVVPAPGPDAPVVLAALADGFDVLVVGRCRALTARDQRSLAARLRSRGAVLLTPDPWPEAHLRVTGRTLGLEGLGGLGGPGAPGDLAGLDGRRGFPGAPTPADGAGYLRGVELEVGVSGRLALRAGTEGRTARVRLGAGGLHLAGAGVTAAAATREPLSDAAPAARAV